MNNDLNQTAHSSGPSKTPFVIIGGALVAALAANGFLWVRSNTLSEEIAKTKDATSVQIAQLNTANESARDEYAKQLEALTGSVKTASTTANTAVARARAEAQKATEQLNEVTGRLEQTQSQLSTDVSQWKGDTTSKLNEVATNVSGVKSDVDTVKTEVVDVKAQVATAQSALEQHATELKRVTGDMGVMSDRIATNGKDLEALRSLGERNYYEFTLSKADKSKKVGDMILTYKKADPKRNRYTVEVAANDKKIEKKDKTANEPVQILLSGNRQASEIVVNQVNKDQIVGYISVPKMMVSQR